MLSLPGALKEQGARVSLVMPCYRSVLSGGYMLSDTGRKLTVPVSDRTEVGLVFTSVTQDGVPAYFIRNDSYFDRDFLYGTPDGDYPDSAERFVFFSRCVAELMRDDPPDIFNANDWQAAMAIVFLKSQPEMYPELTRVKAVMTVHNLGYQGAFWYQDWHLLNLDTSMFNLNDLEFYGTINFLKGGLVHADAITTVSPTYAEEIKTPEQGFRLEGLFRARAADVYGILNGVDYRVWDPALDKLIACQYGPGDLRGKAICKADLQKAYSLRLDARTPLIGMVTRLSSQKGIDLVRDSLAAIMGMGCQLVVLGSGDRAMQQIFSLLATRYPGQFGVQIGFDETLAHKVIAGADFMLMPSRYEPGGLTQLYGLRYGTIPIVRATGGLKDTVREFHPENAAGNGFIFYQYSAQRLVAAVARARATYEHGGPHWDTLMKNAMTADFSWAKSAAGYLSVYQKTMTPTDAGRH
jgi:starch synthase